MATGLSELWPPFVMAVLNVWLQNTKESTEMHVLVSTTRIVHHGVFSMHAQGPQKIEEVREDNGVSSFSDLVDESKVLILCLF